MKRQIQKGLSLLGILFVLVVTIPVFTVSVYEWFDFTIPEKFQEIHPDMQLDAVLEILGSPDYTAFDIGADSDLFPAEKSSLQYTLRTDIMTAQAWNEGKYCLVLKFDNANIVREKYVSIHGRYPCQFDPIGFCRSLFGFQPPSLKRG